MTTSSSLADLMSPAAQRLHRRLLDGHWPALDLIAAAPDEAVHELLDFGLLAATFSEPGQPQAWAIRVTLEPSHEPLDIDGSEADPCTDARSLPDPAAGLVTDAASGVRPDAWER